MRVLVTGGAGFVGRHIVKRCFDDGHSVTVVDDLSTGIAPPEWPWFLRQRKQDKLVFMKQDVRDYFRFAKASTFDWVFHCAAVVGGRKMIEGAPLAVATDLAIDAEFFNWCCVEKKKPKKVVYFSSSAVYPTSLQTQRIHVALSEGLLTIGVPKIGMPDQTYGWAKLSGEVLMHHAVQSYGLNCVCYRPFSGYGEDQDFTYPFPSIIRRVGREENPIVVWGSGDQCRDFIHIADVVEAVFVSMEKMRPGETINLGTGTPTSFKELVKVAKLVLHRGGRIKTMPDEPEGVFWRVADTFNMRRFYTPRILLAEGIKRVHEYQKAMGYLTAAKVPM